MEIYIEAFLLENILINFCLIKLIQSTTKSKTNLIKILIASFVGSILSVFSILIIDQCLLLNFVKLIAAVLMIKLAFKTYFRQTIYNIILLFLYTYALGGLVIELSSANQITPLGIITTSTFTLEIVCILVVILSYIFDLVLKHIKLNVKTNNLIQEVKLTQGNISLKVNAYLDTGNFINHNGTPVLILDLSTFLKLTKQDIETFLINNTETIQTSTVSGSNKLKIYTIDKLEILNEKNKIEIKKQPVAINTTNCFKNTNYQALLSPLFYN